MKNGRHRGMKCRSLLLAGALTIGSSGCYLADDPAYLYVRGVGSGVLSGLISSTVTLIGEAIGNALFPGVDGDAAT